MNEYPLAYNSEYSELSPTIEDIAGIASFAIVEFGAPWCPHCQAGELVLKEGLKGYTTLPHIKLFDGKGKKPGRHYKVKLWPTIVLLKDGVEVARVVRPTTLSDLAPLLNKLNEQ
ncbi:thioredoxin family protein [Vibrio rarus]|uniref:thioredoxin family protein n=1 Tax=Vibrio rarus TaxID=413403 RepID=UPI0021C2AF36|nr:thioredoxin family protein [Vibrio rarus]